MAKATKILIGTDGVGISVTATATPGTDIHTAHATAIDEVWLWAYNNSASDVVLTIEWGAAAEDIVLTIPGQSGLVPVIPGIPLSDSELVEAFAGTTAVIGIIGFVNRIVN
jgi:hypothetical protein